MWHITNKKKNGSNFTYKIYITNFQADRSLVMAANGNPSMISSPSSISNGPEPSQLPPYPPPLRSDHVLQPLSVFPGINCTDFDSFHFIIFFRFFSFDQYPIIVVSPIIEFIISFWIIVKCDYWNNKISVNWLWSTCWGMRMR